MKSYLSIRKIVSKQKPAEFFYVLEVLQNSIKVVSQKKIENYV